MGWRETIYADLHRVRAEGGGVGIDITSVFPDNEETRTILRRDARTWEDDEGLVIAVIGVTELWKGVGTVWTMLSDRARERGPALTFRTVKLLRMLHVERGYKRIQATILHGDERARQWIINLGFTYEGTMVAYAPDGATHDLYARFHSHV